MFNEKCVISKYLAYGMLLYSISSIYYIINTINIGTPFKDSLTPEQIEIKNKSSKIRGTIFNHGLILAFCIIILFKPFEEC